MISLFIDVTLVLLWLKMTLATLLGIVFLCRIRFERDGEESDGSLDISAIVPAFNEEIHIADTLAALLALSPPLRQIIVVDDGSRDRTRQIAEEICASSSSAQVIAHPANSGKASALNTGLTAVSCEHVLMIDADTIVTSNALLAALADLRENAWHGASFRINVMPGSGLWRDVQAQEYRLGHNFDRAGQSILGAISVMPGAATLFVRQALVDGFSDRTCTEDADLTLNLNRAGYRLGLSHRASVVTVAPSSLRSLWRQRRRWTLGHLQCIFLYAPELGGSLRFACLTFPYFLVATLAPLFSVLTFAGLLAVGKSDYLGITISSCTFISIGLFIIQRIVAECTTPDRAYRFSIYVTILEILMLGMIQILAAIGAMWSFAVWITNRQKFTMRNVWLN
ncbi:cellulose synthase/poly-beta-1,6-N-acetylglucosamine synthase-like glycosyltransferase [Peteryoungia aggregata LMG 23059]|uniref:Cellulose synthase/poly-beta-1,6-N-acetylglucosamine synthase-like glycosyltransferase n=1 Tax=Peteryoungia aggregata LMG 23059 TaxID=1368425 RepID=A0ABU0G6K3_9HYPH|nr:glycosyltransferase family 2 protein [Peteryoungia aggregata]MDQ0420928.1 cellulose synthase/poly-beta-1,6-N-acetylglucosamine synthase-like glycosyltransferase [Peteryoungia aggregata LMG 23059]